MTSLVASKPSDGPTSPGLMSYGSDPSALDDYLNLDLFGSSRAAPQSPASSHGALPITPGTSAETQTDETMAFDAFNPLDKMAPFDMGLLGSDLGMDQYGSLFQDMFPSFSEPASGPSAPVIDPQLFAASPPSLPPPIPPPAPAVPASAPTPAPELPLAAAAIVTDDEDDEDEEIAPLPTRTRKPKKNAAAAGGISKRPSRASTPASVLPSYVHFDDPKPVVPPALGKGGVASYLNGERIGSQEPDEWRPTPEEYKKLSSKEKRQLRNKISARNFRVRRKEYITTLESHIADRDQLIAAIRSELSNTHNENTELRREIDALKRAIQEGRLSAADTGLPPPRPLTPEQTATPPTPTTAGPRRPAELTRANTHKDVSSDNRTSFWGGAVGHGGVTSVHTTLIPEVFPQQLSDKPRNVSPSSSGSSSASPSTPPNEGASFFLPYPHCTNWIRTGVNMNPLMNLSPLFSSSKLPNPNPSLQLDVMDQAFNQRTLEGFRAQLWGRMAKEAGARSVLVEQQQQQQRREETPLFTPLVGDMLSPLSSPQQTSSLASPQQSSSSTSPQQTMSSSPSLSMLHQPATTFKSLFDGVFPPSALLTAQSSAQQSSSSPALGQQSSPSLSQQSSPNPAQQQPQQQSFVPAPALLQASSFGAGFLGSQSASNSAFTQSTASMQARAMLQAQWLALQQARQQNASSSPSSYSPSSSSSSQQPMSSSSAQPASSSTQRESYLAQFAQAAVVHQQQQQQQQQLAQAQLSGLAAGVRPAYFTSAKDKNSSGEESKLVSAMSGLAIDKKLGSSDKKATTAGLGLGLGVDKQTLPALSDKKGTTPQQAALAASLASQTLLQRMGSAFWDAFSTGPSRDVDTNKVRRVLEGKAIVKVVDVDGLDGLEEKMRGMSVGVGSTGGGGGVFGNLRGKK
ncbi:bZIP transcription factor, partial [Rhizoctonia solani]